MNMLNKSAGPMVVAEIGANHDGSAEKASRILDAVAKAGVQYVKFQLYTAEEIVADKDRLTKWGPPGRQVEEPVGEMFKRIALPRAAFPDVFAHARQLGLIPFATPFSGSGVDYLMTLKAPFIKIAASDVTHLPLLKYIAATGKPIIISLGKCTLEEADEAVSCLMENGCPELALLHCVAAYPSPMEEMNLRVIPALAKAYPDHVIGFSDHSLGITASLAAVALGARIIEKHVTLDQSASGPDHWFSINMDQLKTLVEGVHDVHNALGSSQKRIFECERGGRERATRSLITARALKAGQIITKEDIKIVRPGSGIPPKFLDAVVGLQIKKHVSRDTPLQWSDFEA